MNAGKWKPLPDLCWAKKDDTGGRKAKVIQNKQKRKATKEEGDRSISSCPRSFCSHTALDQRIPLFSDNIGKQCVTVYNIIHLHYPF